MPRKNNKDWTSVAIKKAILKKLDKLKVHQNQSYSEVIENLLKGATKREVSELK
jgi:predicted CopG family antitoxin